MNNGICQDDDDDDHDENDYSDSEDGDCYDIIRLKRVSQKHNIRKRNELLERRCGFLPTSPPSIVSRTTLWTPHPS